jgi:hypothetical protein
MPLERHGWTASLQWPRDAMSTNDNRRPGVVSRNGGDYDSSNNSSNVIRFPTKLKTCRNSPFDELTAVLVMKRLREGTLDPGVVEAMLVGIGLLR